jgi:hypothetical protein
VHWTVAENNRAVESAWEHPVGRAFARALQHVRWTRESGGHFFGNDEVNRDASYARGGANYITRTYGPLGKQARACSRLCTGRDLMRQCAVEPDEGGRHKSSTVVERAAAMHSGSALESCNTTRCEYPRRWR